MCSANSERQPPGCPALAAAMTVKRVQSLFRGAPTSAGRGVTSAIETAATQHLISLQFESVTASPEEGPLTLAEQRRWEPQRREADLSSGRRSQ